MAYKDYLAHLSKNNGNVCCLPCSRALKATGRNNPNTKYKNIDDNFFEKIDTVEKAYLLGWIGSDGSISKRGFEIRIHQKDLNTLIILKNIICKDIPIVLFETKTSKMCGFTINSTKISKDLCKLFKIGPGKKSDIIKFPKINKKYISYFLRGYFEGDGTLNNRLTSKLTAPACSIASNSKRILKSIKKSTNIYSNIYGNCIEYNAQETISFLDYIYSDVNNNLLLKRKYDLYIDWKNNYIFNSSVNRKRGLTHPNFGKPISAETKQKISKSHSGEKSYRAKLTWEIVNKIRKEYTTGLFTNRQLALKYGMTKSGIGSILNNKTWVDNNFVVFTKNKTDKKRKKLSADAVRKIRILLLIQSSGEIAKKYKVSKQTILAIKHNRIWRDII